MHLSGILLLEYYIIYKYSILYFLKFESTLQVHI